MNNTYDNIVLTIEKFLGINNTAYTKQYQTVFTEIKNTFINRNYEFKDKIVIDESDIALKAVTTVLSEKLANLIVDDTEEKLSLVLIDYAGLDKTELMKNISVLSLISLQNNETVKANLLELKKQYPLRENTVTKLLLYILLFYDMGLVKQTALLASILVVGSINDINI